MRDGTTTPKATAQSPGSFSLAITSSFCKFCLVSAIRFCPLAILLLQFRIHSHFRLTLSIRVIERNQQRRSLAMISARTRIAVLICAAFALVGRTGFLL